MALTQIQSDMLSPNAQVTLASASTVAIGASASDTVSISGTTTITAFDTVASGVLRRVTFQGALTLTYNATSLILPSGASITTSAGDVALFESLGSGNWRCVTYEKANGNPLVNLTLGTAQNTTSGTSIDFTSIPSWVKRITIMFNGVSTNGTSLKQVQIGSGSILTTGYTSSGAFTGTSSSGGNSTTGFVIGGNSATDVLSGHMVLTHFGNNIWIESHTMKELPNYADMGGGDVTLSGALDRIRITTVNGTDTFDAGSVNIMYE